MAEHLELLCYSASFMEPFLRVLAQQGRVAPEVLRSLEAIAPEQRVPIVSAHAFLEMLLTTAPDEALGLKACRELTLGDVGAYDFALSTAASLGDALQVAGRYARLVNDAASWSLAVEGGLAIVRIHNQVETPRVALDFQLGGFLRNHSNVWPRGLTEELEVHFPYPAPADVSEHQRTFQCARLLFGMPHLGFAFPARFLELPLRSTDPRLHRIVRAHAEAILAELPRTLGLVDRVRTLLLEELAGGDPTAKRIARRLTISKRTLERRLLDEGTTFHGLVDALRRDLAVNYLWTTDVSITEVALLTGFSSSTAFHRAFRRWTGKTPRDFARERGQRERPSAALRARLRAAEDPSGERTDAYERPRSTPPTT